MNIEKMSEQEKKETLQEAKLLEALDHPNIIRFKEVYKTK
jgi:NIMA (never in mitosis gene a)-related kinase 1/4/5